MSARKILGKNMQLNRKNKLNKQISRASIRTFLDIDSFQLISKPSLFYLLLSSEDTKYQLNKIRMMAAHRKLVYLTDVQFHWMNAYFTMHQNPVEGKWFGEKYNNIKDYNIYINPQIVSFQGEKKQVKQCCHSFPFMTAVIERNSSITLKYTKITNLDENTSKIVSQEVEQRMDGFKSVVAQHCLDHLKGVNFFDPLISKGKLQLFEIGNNFQKTKFILKQFNLLTKKALDDKKQRSEQFQKVRTQYHERIRKSLSEEMANAKKDIDLIKIKEQ